MADEDEELYEQFRVLLQETPEAIDALREWRQGQAKKAASAAEASDGTGGRLRRAGPHAPAGKPR